MVVLRRFTAEAMIHGFHEYKKVIVKNSGSFYANGRCVSFIIKVVHKRLAAPDYVTLNNVENWQINLANCCNLPNSPTVFLRQSFLLKF